MKVKKSNNDRMLMFKRIGLSPDVKLGILMVAVFKPLCKKYPNNYDLGREWRKRHNYSKFLTPNDYDLGFKFRRMVNNFFNKPI